jgi:hypothetical protein
MNDTNLFKHSPKELVTDGFITWILYFLASNSDYEEGKNNFFNKLILKKDDVGKTIDSIKIKMQEKGKNGRPDIVLSFNLDGQSKKVLFENKTWTTTSYSQLNGYRDDYGDIYRYVFLKLAYININERHLCKKCGYDIISSENLLGAITGIQSLHPFIAHYAEYIENVFVNKIKDLRHKLSVINDFRVLEEAQGQEMFMSQLFESLENNGISGMRFNTGSSFGPPWTEIEICNTKVQFLSDNTEKQIADEMIFWRVDIRASKYYVRLNQYTNKPSKTYLVQKKERLKILRDIAKQLIQEDEKLIGGKLHNNAKAESEIAIFFEDKNEINYLLEVLPKFSKKFVEEYKKMNDRLIQ